MAEAVASLEDVRRTFVTRRGTVNALDGVDLSIGVDEAVALVGESGSGKSTIAQILVGLTGPTTGTVRLWNQDIRTLDRRARSALRRRVGIVFQDPFISLDPRMTIGRIVAEPLAIHGVGTRADRAARARELLESVGLPEDWVRRRPAQLSGGQRQRVAIARAIALEPELLILDEPVSSLDVSVQAQILTLLSGLRERMHFACLFVSHDLAVVRHVADRVAVLYLGRVVEEGSTERVFEAPLHPYTIALLSSSVDFDADEDADRRILLDGDPPSPIDRPSGCAFRTRCFRAEALCADRDPRLIATEEPPHRVACHFSGVMGSRAGDRTVTRSHGAHSRSTSNSRPATAGRRAGG
jgi:oligopeptide transport system ATP-binding protein